MRRRAFLAASAALGASAWPSASAAAGKALTSNELELSTLELGTDRAFGRALLAVPKQLPSSPALLVLLHGLGESHDQEIGARAFAERYGLLSAVSRLLQPPLERTLKAQDFFGEGRVDEINRRLSARPFQCPILLCPFTPNPYKAAGEATLARFASFIAGPLKAEVEQRTRTKFPAQRCMISGVSMGGYVAIEVFLRQPELFSGLGTAQGAFGPNQASRYAARIAEATERVGPRRIEILTSSNDPYRRVNELFHQHLQKKGQASTLRVSPGPHDQRWLNESGTIEMLLSADDVFAASRSKP
jgi:predicted esterase